MSEAVRIRRVVGVADDIAGVELRGVFQNGGFELAQLLEDEVALSPAVQLDAVDGGAGLDGRVVRRVEGAAQEGVEEAALPAAAGAEDVAEEDVALDAGGALAAAAGLGDFHGGGGGGAAAAAFLGGLEAEVGEVLEGCAGFDEGRHAPLGEPALQGDVAGFVADGGGGEGGVEPGGGEAGRWGEEGGELGGAEAAVVVAIGEEEEVGEEAVACWRKLGG